MEYKALVSFSGVINAHVGQVITINDKTIAKDLLEANYIELVDAKPKKGKVKAGDS